MSDGGKLDKPPQAAPPVDTKRSEAAPPGYVPTAPTSASPSARVAAASADRSQARSEALYRASGGQAGTPPAARIFDHRRAVGANVAGRLMRWAERSTAKAGSTSIPDPGGPLPGGLRQKMERKLGGADLSKATVSTSTASAEAAKALGAKAFTHGQDIHFGQGQYHPDSPGGLRLLSHELVHVAQAKRAGVQRKADEGEAAADSGAEQAAPGLDGAEVSHPDDPAEKEADAIAEKVAESEESAGAEGAEGKAAGAEGAEGEAPGAEGEAGAEGAEAGAEASEQPMPISAKLEGVGRKIFRTLDAGGEAARGTGSAETSVAAGQEADPKAAQIEKAKNCKTEADVDAFCASDPIAKQKLADVNQETNMEGDANEGARKGFYQAVAGWIQSNAETLNPATIFNQCFNTLSTPWKFKGKKVDFTKLPKAFSRTQGLSGFWWTAVDQAQYMKDAEGTPDQKKTAYNMWVKDAKAGNVGPIRSDGTISPPHGTWFTPDSYKLTDASDAGYGQLLELAALQPEWFPEGNIVFDVDTAAAAGTMEARKPTAFDGMQSVLWVSRPGPETYGVTGGGAQEFLAKQIPTSAVKNPRAVIPSDDTQAQLREAIQGARELALAQDPELKKRIEAAPAGSDARKQFEAMVPNLTDMFIRGTATMPMGAMVRKMLQTIKAATEGERANPSAPRTEGQITAPSVGGGA
jgi:hypothetical protein